MAMKLLSEESAEQQVRRETEASRLRPEPEIAAPQPSESVIREAALHMIALALRVLGERVTSVAQSVFGLGILAAAAIAASNVKEDPSTSQLVALGLFYAFLLALTFLIVRLRK